MAGRLCNRILDRARFTGANRRGHEAVDGILGVLGRGEWTRKRTWVQLTERWASRVFCHLRRTDLEGQKFAPEFCYTERGKFKLSESIMNSGVCAQFGSASASIFKGVCQRRTPSGTHSFEYRRDFSTAHMVTPNIKPLQRSFHSSLEDDTTGQQTVEEIEGGTHALSIGSLDLPKIANPTTDLINKLFGILGNVQEWGPETIRELEDSDVKITPFVIQQTVLRLSHNVHMTWQFFQWAREKLGSKLTVRPHVAVLDVLGRAKEFDLMKQAFSLLSKDGHKKSAWPYNNAIKWCAEANDVETALFFWRKLKDDKCKPTVVTYTRVIDVLARQGRHQEGLEIFKEMLQASCPPNISTYNVLLNALKVAGQPEVASSLFEKLSELGCKPNYSTYSTLICLHAEAGKPEKALKYFNMMKAAGLEVGDDIYKAMHTALPSSTANEVASTEGTASFVAENTSVASAGSPDVDFSVSGSSSRIIKPNALVKLLERGESISVEAKLERIRPKIDSRLVVQVLQRLKNLDTALIFANWAKSQPHFKHSEYSYSMMINILGRSRKREALDQLIKEMQEQGIKMTTSIFTSLISCYGRAKSKDGSLKLFEQMKAWGCKPDVITYTTLIHLLAKDGSYDLAEDMFEEMKQAGISPNTHTYSVMIYNLVKGGKVAEGVSLLERMPELGCEPSSVTFATLIDHCVKKGDLDMAKDLYLKMEEKGIKPLRTTITVLDGAYRKAGRMADADSLVEKSKHIKVWDKIYKSSTEKVAQELLFKDLSDSKLETVLCS